MFDRCAFASSPSPPFSNTHICTHTTHAHTRHPRAQTTTTCALAARAATSAPSAGRSWPQPSRCACGWVCARAVQRLMRGHAFIPESVAQEGWLSSLLLPLTHALAHAPTHPHALMPADTGCRPARRLWLPPHLVRVLGAPRRALLGVRRAVRASVACLWGWWWRWGARGALLLLLPTSRAPGLSPCCLYPSTRCLQHPHPPTHTLTTHAFTHPLSAARAS